MMRSVHAVFRTSFTCLCHIIRCGLESGEAHWNCTIIETVPTVRSPFRLRRKVYPQPGTSSSSLKYSPGRAFIALKRLWLEEKKRAEGKGYQLVVGFMLPKMERKVMSLSLPCAR
jgi:hypothetical protein